MINYKTVFQEAKAEDSIKKSKFIAHVRPIETEKEAQDFIASIKKEHWNANHNVPVYCLGAKFEVQRYSDDGEPSGTAGVPILDMLKNEGITNVCIVVTRYFGGIKLGTGGLVRAYTQSAKHGLEESVVVDKLSYEQVSFDVAYTLHGKVENFLKDLDYYIEDEVIFTDQVTIKGYVAPEYVEVFKGKLTELSSASINIESLGETYLMAKDKKIVK